MKKVLVLTGSTLGSYLGWWAGAPIGMVTAFMLSMVGLGLGMYAGNRLCARLLDT
jgi:hypothetical protein